MKSNIGLCRALCILASLAAIFLPTAAEAAVDFVVTTITLSPTTPAVGASFTAYVTVKNQGTVSGSGGYLDVWKHQPASQACGADGDTYQSVGTLAAGASVTKTFTLTAGSAANYTFRAFVDSACGTTESSEANNQSTLGYTVQPVVTPPDFLVTAISFSPSTPTAGASFTAYVTVKNQGTASGNGGFLDVWKHQPASQACGADGDTYHEGVVKGS